MKKIKPQDEKCPKCGCTEIKSSSYCLDHGILEEYVIKCGQCENIKEHWVYGNTYVMFWKDMTNPPLIYRIKDYLKRVLRKKRKKTMANDDLQF